MADDSAPTTEQVTTEAANERPLSLLASELYGPAFHGEVKKPEETKTEELPPEPTAEGDPPAEEPEKEESPISSFSELIEHYELDPDWATTLRVPVKIDGQTSEATMADLVASYQIKEAATHRLEEAKAKAKQIVEDAAAKATNRSADRQAEL